MGGKEKRKETGPLPVRYEGNDCFRQSLSIYFTFSRYELIFNLYTISMYSIACYNLEKEPLSRRSELNFTIGIVFVNKFVLVSYKMRMRNKITSTVKWMRKIDDK
jgi:hypothetical protein